MMHFVNEHRLVFRTLEDLNKQRKAAGVDPAAGVAENRQLAPGTPKPTVRSINQAYDAQIQSHANQGEQAGQVQVTATAERIGDGGNPINRQAYDPSQSDRARAAQGQGPAENLYDPNSLSYSYNAPPTTEHKAQKAEQDVKDFYDNLTLQGQSIDPAARDRDLQMARDKVYQADAMIASKEQARQQMDRERVAATNTSQTSSAPSGSPASTVPGQPDMRAATGAPQMPDPALSQVLGLLPPEMQFMAPLLQQAYQGAEQSEMNAAAQYGQRMGNAQQMYQTAGGMLLNQLNRAGQNLATNQKFIQGSLDQQNQLIALQKENDLAKSHDEEERSVRTATQDLQDIMEEMQAEIALGGAIGSSNANDRVREVRQRGEQAIIDLQKDFGFKRSDISAYYTTESLKAHQGFVTEWMKATDAYETKVNGVELGFVGLEEKKAEILDKAAVDYYAATDKAAEKQADRLDKAVGYVYDVLKEERATKRQEDKDKKSTAYDFFTWSFANSSDPGLRGKAVDMMTKAGYDMKGVDLEALTVDDQLALMDNLKATETATTTDPFRFDDPRSRQIMQDAHLAVIGAGSNEYKTVLLNQVADMLDAGRTDEAESRLQSIAAASLVGTPKEKYGTVLAELNTVDGLIPDLQQLGRDGGVRGFYTMKWNEAMKYLNTSKNEGWLDISSRMANLASKEIQKRSGAAVSPQEFQRLEKFIPTAEDTVVDALVKLRNLKKEFKNETDSIINVELGRISPVNAGSTSSSYGGEKT